MTSCHVWFAVNTNKLLNKLNPDFFITLCELNLDITEHMCLPTQSNPLSPASAKILARVCNAITRHPIELESYPNHPRIQQVSCLKSKKKRFSFSVWASLGDRCKWGCFCFFLATFTWPWTPTHWAIVLAHDFLETRPKSASLEPLNDIPAYQERKLWLINQKLTKILLPQKPLWMAFLPRQQLAVRLS